MKLQIIHIKAEFPYFCFPTHIPTTKSTENIIVTTRPNTSNLMFSSMYWCHMLNILVFGYRWEVVGDEDGIQYGPFPVPKGGLPIRVHHKVKNWSIQFKYMISASIGTFSLLFFFPWDAKGMHPVWSDSCFYVSIVQIFEQIHLL